MFFSTLRFLLKGWVPYHFANTAFHFKYFGFEWIPELPLGWIYGMHFLLLIAALSFMIGFFYRASAVILFLSFTYIELIDLTYYLNHYYFVSLVALMMIFLPANRSLSADVALNIQDSTTTTKMWHISAIKLQLAIVYIFAGIAKINHPWLLEALPLKIWLPAHNALPIIGWLFNYEWVAFVFAWAGMLFDSLIIFFLINQKTRIWAYMTVVLFHTLTGILFQIGIFPLVMIASTLIFFSENWHLKIQERITSIANFRFTKFASSYSMPSKKTSHDLKLYFFIFFFAIQLILPWRYLLYDGPLFWTEEGYRFSWRVMLMEKAGTATFYVKDSVNGKTGIVNNAEFLNAHQEKQMAFQPDMILQYAHFLHQHFEKIGYHEPQITAEVYVTLNAKPSRIFIDPEVNLAQISDSWRQKSWIQPYPSDWK